MKTLLTVAIVDDFPRWRDYFNEYLTSEGFSTFCQACDGVELLSQLQNAEALPSLCLLDVNMPVMNGFDTAMRLRKQYPSIRILAYSTDYDNWTVNKIIECGAHAFIRKGSAPWEIKDALLELIEQ